MIANSRQEAPANTPTHRHGFSVIKICLAIAIVAISVALFLPATRNVRPAAYRSQCKNNLKQIGLALHNYHDEYQAFPPAYTVDADGKPLHSWRTLILPYMEQKAAVRQDRPDEAVGRSGECGSFQVEQH